MTRRLLVVSHPSVLPVNQLPYVELERRGWTVEVIVPRVWSHAYSAAPVVPEPHPDLAGAYRPLPVALVGRPQRHFYLASPTARLRRFRPDFVLLEQEAFSAAAGQWALAAHRLGIPFAVQAAENLDRRLALPVRAVRSWVLRHAGLVIARSDRAAELARAWGATGDVQLIPHHLPHWPAAVRAPSTGFRIGYAGRLVPEKGLDVLVDALRLLGPPADLIVAGDGPLREWLQSQDLGGRLTVHTDLSHDAMPQAYSAMDVLVLPSRSTPTWTEQFGRVLVEALSFAVPVVGSDSGEIGWVIEVTGGGFVFPEGDAGALAGLLTRLRGDPALRASLGRVGQERARALFNLSTVADRLNAALVANLASDVVRRS